MSSTNLNVEQAGRQKLILQKRRAARAKQRWWLLLTVMIFLDLLLWFQSTAAGFSFLLLTGPWLAWRYRYLTREHRFQKELAEQAKKTRKAIVIWQSRQKYEARRRT